MKIVITGSRYKKVVADNLKSFAHGQRISEMELIHGNCPDSFDMLCAEFATNAGWKVTPMPADWKKYGKAAGMIRNQDMVDRLDPDKDFVVSFNLGTAGTNDCVRRSMNKEGLVVYQNGYILEHY